MKILITGNMGYVGPVVLQHLRQVLPSATLIGFDSGFFAGCLTGNLTLPELRSSRQMFGDVRAFDAGLMEGVDVVIHLAAISNDPMGKAYETVTDDINHLACLDLARKARDYGVQDFVFASSCSVYGAGGTSAKTETSKLNPLTAYAKSKIASEIDLKQIADDDFRVTCLRFATACGFSPRTRLDLVVNDFVACALTTRRIDILSDGTPWRPIIDIHDMARAVEWATIRSRENDSPFICVNVGSNSWNFQVKEIAERVQQVVGNVEINVNADAEPDKRSYRVDFGMFMNLAPDHQPLYVLDESIRELRSGLADEVRLDSEYRVSNLFARLHTLAALRTSNRLDERLMWVS